MKVEDHQVILRFEGGKILVKHSYFRTTDPFDSQGNLDVTSCWDDEKKILTLNSQKLQLTVAKPKQKGEKSTKNAVFVKSVLEKFKDVSFIKLLTKYNEIDQTETKKPLKLQIIIMYCTFI